MIKVKRIYEKPSKDDGYRILVDRLWARGLTKEKAKIDLWLKEIAPSNELRKWYNHDPEKWDLFKEKYREELKGKKEFLVQIKKLEKEHRTVTLLFSSKEEKLNNAAALLEFIK
ncbi:DUF488 domain-containing protein [Melioribacteraceae bacterium 4301-Me]|uniref:DUF488 domain-containing protein n=1 Tax=Pyranulibacter aquaticus TaxID=3163344 RepID=UPI003598EA48